MTVFDVGARVGIYTIAAATAVGPDGHVTAFEPSARNVALLRRHLELNRITNADVIEMAVGQTAGTVRFATAEGLGDRI